MTAHGLSLEGKVALVTGSTRGIGRAIAVTFAAAGATVAVHGSTAAACDASVIDEIRDEGGRAAGFGADLTDPGACCDLIASVTDAFGTIDILVLNASWESRASWQDIDVTTIDRHWYVNFRSSLLLCQQAVPAMQARGWGRIIALGSIQECKPNPNLLVYAATKAAQDNMVRTLARELGPVGITVNNLAPGAIETDRNAAVLKDAAIRDRVIAQIPVGRIGIAEDCVGAALLLASDAGSYINGTTLRVDGGWHL